MKPPQINHELQKIKNGASKNKRMKLQKIKIGSPNNKKWSFQQSAMEPPLLKKNEASTNKKWGPYE